MSEKHNIFLCKDGIEVEEVSTSVLGSYVTTKKIPYEQDAAYKNLLLTKITPIVVDDVLIKIQIQIKKINGISEMDSSTRGRPRLEDSEQRKKWRESQTKHRNTTREQYEVHPEKPNIKKIPYGFQHIGHVYSSRNKRYDIIESDVRYRLYGHRPRGKRKTIKAHYYITKESYHEILAALQPMLKRGVTAIELKTKYKTHRFTYSASQTMATLLLGMFYGAVTMDTSKNPTKFFLPNSNNSSGQYSKRPELPDTSNKQLYQAEYYQKVVKPKRKSPEEHTVAGHYQDGVWVPPYTRGTKTQ